MNNKTKIEIPWLLFVKLNIPTYRLPLAGEVSFKFGVRGFRVVVEMCPYGR
jgi:hypothetical protein